MRLEVLIVMKIKTKDFLDVTPSECMLSHSIRGHVVAQFVEALRYKPEGHGFDSQWCHWNF
jgi:hypothetical protein